MKKQILTLALLLSIGATAQKQHASGDGATASAYYSTAVGDDAKATQDHTTAIGRAAQATAYQATALGDNARAIAKGSTALGRDALTQGEWSTAVGNGAKTGANATGAIQLGGGENFEAYTVQLGNGSGMRLKGVANGVNDKDAVNVSQLNATKLQTAQDIATAKTQAIQSAKTYTDSKIREVNNKIDLNAETAKLYTDKETERATNEELKINKRIDALELKMDYTFKNILRSTYNEFQAVNNRIEGLGAATVALSAAASSQIYSPTKPTNINIGTGVYGKATAIAVGMSHYFNAQTKLSVNYAAGSNTKNLVGIGVGFGF